MSRSRAKKKQRRRARAASGPAGAAGAQAGDAGQARRERTAQRDRERRPEAAARGRDRFEVRDGIARPEPIWSPFPLTEIGILAGMVIFFLGLFATPDRSPELLGTGAIVLAVVVGEMCLREHFAGFRSHSILLALLPVTVLHTFVVYAITPSWTGPVALVVDLALAGALAWFLHGRFRSAHAAARSVS
ncbi:MAG: hypothetical protein M3401_13950 [Actinomycetota bacterium]|nr:hypothetical protein [Actinomycetota bacterium]